MGDRMYRLVASDMDETFLDADHAIPASNLRALKRMRELGVLFVPSSGRWYSSIMDNFSGEAHELIENGYVLSYNGGFINRVGDPPRSPPAAFPTNARTRSMQRGSNSDSACTSTLPTATCS